MIKTREEVNLLFIEGGIDAIMLGLYRRTIDRNPETRQAIVELGVPYLAFRWSQAYDRYPRKDLRQVACQDPWHAYLYARCVDRKPRPETREAAKGGYTDTYKTWEDIYMSRRRRKQEK